MPKVLPAIFSYEDMKSRFAQDNPDEPYTRRADLESGIYALDSWLIRVDDDNKAISTVGFKEHPSHTVVGGMYASAKGREIGGNNRALQIAREPQLNQSKPLVAAFGHRDGDNARWIAKAKQNGWKFPEDNDFQQVSQMLPEQIVNAWNSAYPNGNWAIRSIRGEGDFAKCVFIDDPMPAWFNVIKYLPDNTWDDFELGEPVPDLGTRDRFKDKNIKSKGKAEYKAFITQQYLRQVSDRIPNAGTSLMQGWLEKLTELDLDKGKYWYFGTNVKQDRTYVMIDIIEKGQTYTRTAGKKFNLEEMDKGIVFIGVSKEMVGKIKRGQGIPKGRKFIDLHGKYGVRGLRGQRRLPKQPTNPFPKPQDIEKSWMNIIKILPDDTFEEAKDTKGDAFISPYNHDDGEALQYSSQYNLMYRKHYLDMLNSRFKDHPDYTTEKLEEIAAELDTKQPRKKGWIYINDDPKDFSYLTFRVIPRNGAFKGGAYFKNSSTIQFFANQKPKNIYILDSIRGEKEDEKGKFKYMGYPSDWEFYNIFVDEIKEGHLMGDSYQDTIDREAQRIKEEREKKESEEEDKRREEIRERYKKQREYYDEHPEKEILDKRRKLINRIQSDYDQIETRTVNTSQGKVTRKFNIESARKRLKELENIEPMVEEFANKYTGKEKTREKEIDKYRTRLNEEKKWLETFIKEKINHIQGLRNQLQELSRKGEKGKKAIMGGRREPLETEPPEEEKMWKQLLRR